MTLDKYVTGAKKELDEFCDAYFNNDAEAEDYCMENDIPNKMNYELLDL